MIMKLSIFLALLQYVFIFAYTPGPANFFALQTSSQFGYKQFLKVYPGLLLGCISLFSACTCLLLFLTESVPQLTQIFTYLGMIYILIFAWKIFKSAPPENISDTQKTSSDQPTFLTGFIINITNVKIMIFGFTVLQLYILPYTTSLPQIFMSSLFIAVFTTTSTLVWGYLGSLLQGIYLKYHRIFNTTMALMLISCFILSICS